MKTGEERDEQTEGEAEVKWENKGKRDPGKEDPVVERNFSGLICYSLQV